ncbi:MAG: adenosine deaminase [Bifidobacteriaceae bacterium]|nr:adenosine deaminase [Bifidobacteriaceae bacterium]
MDHTELRKAIACMPKTELHLHIEGTLEAPLALQLASRNNVSLPWNTLEELEKQYDFSNLQSFLDLYYILMGTLKTQEDFADLMFAYLQRAHENGIRHAEIFFDPQVHMNNHIPFSTVIKGLLNGLDLGKQAFGITGGLILCIIRDMPVESAEAVLKEAEPYAKDLIGIGLDSAEVGYPPELFEAVYRKARQLGLHCVAHAGEEGPADYVKQALDVLHVERIDHGIHAYDDPELVQRLAQEQIPLTSCPLSNKRLKVVNDIRELPLHEMLQAGLRVCINSDDPAYFGGYLVDNYMALLENGYSLEECATFARNSIEACFISREEKDTLLADFDKWYEQYVK